MTIREFLATVKSAGLAKSSKYMVVLDLPKDLQQTILGVQMFGVVLLVVVINLVITLKW